MRVQQRERPARGASLVGETRSPRRVSPDVEDSRHAERPMGPGLLVSSRAPLPGVGCARRVRTHNPARVRILGRHALGEFSANRPAPTRPINGRPSVHRRPAGECDARLPLLPNATFGAISPLPPDRIVNEVTAKCCFECRGLPRRRSLTGWRHCVAPWQAECVPSIAARATRARLFGRLTASGNTARASQRSRRDAQKLRKSAHPEMRVHVFAASLRVLCR